MKKEYIKPTLLVIKTEPSQIMATSPGSEGDGTGGMGGIIDGEEGEDTGLEGGIGNEYDPVCTKGGLWDEYTW